MFRPSANVYIDGFNLYYGCIRGSRHKWLDLAKWCRFAIQEYSIHRIRYFTAVVLPRPNDPLIQQRQLTYLRALRTIPNLSIHEGFFKQTQQRVRLVSPIPCIAPVPCIGQTVLAHKTEEKGSDVNLATFLLIDAVDGDADVSVVVSDDTDLLEPIRLVRQRFGRDVLVLNPHRGRQLNRDLRQVATSYRTLTVPPLRACQFPRMLSDANGVITKPATW
ncbi:MAG: NYN domain-containing protein [Dehalococcoidia bacterium]